MSKIGKKVIQINDGVEVSINGDLIIVKGNKGELTTKIPSGVFVKKNDNIIVFSIDNEEHKKYRGLTRTLVDNMINGVTNGYSKKLMITGVGYGGVVNGNKLILSLGFSHKIDFIIPNGVNILNEQDPKGNTILTISGIDKQLVGETTSNIRSIKKPEPYKGKGIRYLDEFIKLKPGKAAKK